MNNKQYSVSQALLQTAQLLSDPELRKVLDAPYELRKREYGDLMRVSDAKQEELMTALKRQYKPDPPISKPFLRKLLKYSMLGLLAVGLLQQA